MRGPGARRGGRGASARGAGEVQVYERYSGAGAASSDVATVLARALARGRRVADPAIAVGRILEAMLPSLGAEFALAVDADGVPLASVAGSDGGLRFAIQENDVLLAAGEARSAGATRTARGDVAAFPMRSGGREHGVLVLQSESGAGNARFEAAGELLAECLGEMVEAIPARRTARGRSGGGGMARRLFDAIAAHRDGVALFGAHGRLVVANAAFAAAHGADAEALSGLTLEEILARSDDGASPVLLARSLNEHGGELALSGDGTWRRLSRARTPAGDELVLQTPTDGAVEQAATARRRLGEAQGEIEQLKGNWAALPVGMLLLSRTGRVADFNAEVVRLLGVRPQRLAGVRLGRLAGAAGGNWRTVARADGGGQLAVRAVALDDGKALIALIEAPAAAAPDAAELEKGRRAVRATEALAELGHEMRTPLNAVIGFADIMLARSFGPINDRQAQYLSDIAGAGRHMLEMVEHMLNHAQLTAGRYALEPDWHDFGAMAAEAARLLEPTAAQGGVKLIRPDDERFEVLVDRRGCLQMLINLLANAVKFTPRGGEVALYATVDAGELRLVVEDTGEGIAPEDLERVVEPFTQARRLGGRPLKGAGLGLSIVRAIAELHGGEVRIESQPGEGTRVTVRLPADRARPRPRGRIN